MDLEDVEDYAECHAISRRRFLLKTARESAFIFPIGTSGSKEKCHSPSTVRPWSKPIASECEGMGLHWRISEITRVTFEQLGECRPVDCSCLDIKSTFGGAIMSPGGVGNSC
ncbi:hypothetical protein CEXT_693771 [Caerostris extrusa]|uniref:Uncharacterized protein n=1 Tax=Caerostris extrusa TaxID=172846 RepID=A0AAV4XYB7_CAEEX|nr:hypothetical protein CEXT_693771 [Caerostris extrusa]